MLLLHIPQNGTLMEVPRFTKMERT